MYVEIGARMSVEKKERALTTFSKKEGALWRKISVLLLAALRSADLAPCRTGSTVHSSQFIGPKFRTGSGIIHAHMYNIHVHVHVLGARCG